MSDDRLRRLYYLAVFVIAEGLCLAVLAAHNPGWGVLQALFMGSLAWTVLMTVPLEDERLSDAVEDWARQNGFRFLRKERRKLFCGPFTFSLNAHVHRFTVQDRRGRERAGWVAARRGLIGNDITVEVCWEGEPNPRPQGDPRDSPLWDRDLDS